MISGAAIGIGVGAGIGLGVPLPGIPWLLAVGLIKLTLLGSGVLMGAGAFMERLGRRKEQDRFLPTEGP